MREAGGGKAVVALVLGLCAFLVVCSLEEPSDSVMEALATTRIPRTVSQPQKLTGRLIGSRWSDGSVQLRRKSLSPALILLDAAAKVSPEVQTCINKAIAGDSEKADALRATDKPFLKLYHALISQHKAAHDEFEAQEQILDAKAKRATTYCKTAAVVVRGTDDMTVCKGKVYAEVAEARRLLEAQSPWFKVYSEIIQKSVWYPKYEAHTTALMKQCHLLGYSQVVAPTSAPTAAPTSAAKAQASYASSYSSTEAAPVLSPVKKPAYTSAPTVAPTSAPTEEPKSTMDDAVKKGKAALDEAKDKQQAKVAKEAVMDNMKRKGIPGANSAEKVAWAKHKLAEIRKWAESTIRHIATAIDTAGGYRKGDVAAGQKHKASTEEIRDAMFAVEQATKQSVYESQQEEDRDKQKLLLLAKPIKLAREAARDAELSVSHAQRALARTRGTASRAQAKRELQNAQEAVQNAHDILRVEVTRKDALVREEMRKIDARVVAKAELQTLASATYEEAEKVLLLVIEALSSARASHQAHVKSNAVEAKATAMEKGAKELQKERLAKSHKKARGVKLRHDEKEAQRLDADALAAGIKARNLMQKAAEAGRIAALKMVALAELRADLYKEAHPSEKGAADKAVYREATAAMLAVGASAVEDEAMAARQKMHPLLVEEAIRVKQVKASDLKAAEEVHDEAERSTPSANLLAKWRKEKGMWKEYYKRYYANKWRDAKAKHDALVRKVMGLLPPAVAFMNVDSRTGSRVDEAFEARLAILLDG